MRLSVLRLLGLRVGPVSLVPDGSYCICQGCLLFFGAAI